MPEGDTIFRTAAVLRDVLVGDAIVGASARARPGSPRPPRVETLIGTSVTSVEPRGKHLLIGFSSGATLHTHLGLHGSWHRYAHGERWLRPERTASITLTTPNAVVACFRPSRVELLTSRDVERLPALRELGPDLLAPSFDPALALARLRERDGVPIAHALLDQRAIAGIGNVYKSELLFLRGVEPWTPVAEVDDATLRGVIEDARRLLAANVRGGARRTTGSDPAAARGSLWVYGRTGRPCRRCGSAVRSRRDGPLARMTYWCPTCQTRSGESA